MKRTVLWAFLFLGVTGSFADPSPPGSIAPEQHFSEAASQPILPPLVLEPMAERMLASDPKLAAEFKQKLATDDAFRASSKDRLRWFYSKTPFVDERWKLYPVGREE